jgi:uncharacterized protein (DUF1778 family)
MPQTIQRNPARNRRTPLTKTYRFDARLNEEQKFLIQRAADMEGRSMTDFVLHSAETAAERILERRTMLVMTARESKAFADALLKPASPGAVLRRAARDYRAKTRV